MIVTVPAGIQSKLCKLVRLLNEFNRLWNETLAAMVPVLGIKQVTATCDHPEPEFAEEFAGHVSHLRLQHLAVVQPGDGLHALDKALECHFPVLLVHLKEFLVHHDILHNCPHFNIVVVQVLFVVVLCQGVTHGSLVWGPLGRGVLVHLDLLLGKDDAARGNWLHAVAQDDRAEEF